MYYEPPQKWLKAFDNISHKGLVCRMTVKLLKWIDN